MRCSFLVAPVAQPLCLRASAGSGSRGHGERTPVRANAVMPGKGCALSGGCVWSAVAVARFGSKSATGMPTPRSGDAFEVSDEQVPDRTECRSGTDHHLPAASESAPTRIRAASRTSSARRRFLHQHHARAETWPAMNAQAASPQDEERPGLPPVDLRTSHHAPPVQAAADPQRGGFGMEIVTTPTGDGVVVRVPVTLDIL